MHVDLSTILGLATGRLQKLHISSFSVRNVLSTSLFISTIRLSGLEELQVLNISVSKAEVRNSGNPLAEANTAHLDLSARLPAAQSVSKACRHHSLAMQDFTNLKYLTSLKKLILSGGLQFLDGKNRLPDDKGFDIWTSIANMPFLTFVSLSCFQELPVPDVGFSKPALTQLRCDYTFLLPPRLSTGLLCSFTDFNTQNIHSRLMLWCLQGAESRGTGFPTSS